MNSKKMPQTDSIQELAQFWDTHDLTDFEEELEEVHEPVFNSQVTVSLTTEEVQDCDRYSEGARYLPT